MDTNIKANITIDSNVSNKYNLKPGAKCLVWGKKSTPEKGVIKYFSYTSDGYYYFNNSKTDAISGRKEFTRMMFGGYCQSWRNFRKLEIE